jgi:hypothetical protein
MHARTPRTEVTKDYIEATREFWQAHTPRELSREDAREMAHNLVGFFNVLRDWKIAEQESQKATPHKEIPS